MKALENMFAGVAKTAIAVGTTASAGGFVAASDAGPPQAAHAANASGPSPYSQVADLCVAPISSKDSLADSELVTRPPKEEEVDAVIATVRARTEEIWESMLPSGFNNQDLVFKAVKEMVMRHPTLVQETRQNIDNELKKKEAAALNPWSVLRSKYTCEMCHDVLAAPVVLPCTHNYCGMCLHDMFASCQSNEVEVAHQCRVCGCDQIKLDHAIYERTLDLTIEAEVLLLPDCAEKREWRRRQHAYHDQLMKKAGKKEEAPFEMIVGAVVVAIVALVAGLLLVVVRGK